MISFVGAGPGAADLITIRGAQRLGEASVVIWASSLVPEQVLAHCGPGTKILDSATMTMEDVIGVYQANPDVSTVRLHSGDPSIFGALQEQIDWCLANERSFEVVPGVSSLSAAAAALGRELTIPSVSQSIVLTRLAGRTRSSVPDGPGGEDVPDGEDAGDVARLATHGCTMAVFLSAARPRELEAQLLGPKSGFSADTPAAIIIRASWPNEQVIRTTVGRLSTDLAATKQTRTVLVLVGQALEMAGTRSNLYSPSFSHHFRVRSKPGSTTGRPSRAHRPR